MESSRFFRTVYSLRTFLEVEVKQWGGRLREHHIDCMGEEASRSQIFAWSDCFTILKKEIALLTLPPELKENIFLVFEYELPRERGRRPDVLLLSGQSLAVLEFKGHSKETQAQIDQVRHYARDLRSYHECSHHLSVTPFLVLAGGQNVSHEKDGVNVVSGDRLGATLSLLATSAFNGIEQWFESDYAPLPSLIQSAQSLFRKDRFPQIKRAHSAGIPKTLQKLADLAKRSQEEQTHYLALITGVPGAGKTLVGLQFVLDTYVQQFTQKGVFLSGNGPLVEVLQFSLGNRNFVQPVHGFLKQYAHREGIPSEDVIIYDEAQRAWDSERVSSSPRIGSNAEPTDFVTIGDRKSHCLLIGLIGEGQEIYWGEEGGTRLWHEAIQQSPNKWKIHCPVKLIDIFSDVGAEAVGEFDLTTSLRTHQALTLQRWVADLVDGNISSAKEVSSRLFDEDYPIYVTRILDRAKRHVVEKYEDEPHKTFGLIASSQSRILPKHGIMNDFKSTKSVKPAQYYVDANHGSYCRNLNSVVTEFGCQGLELDMPILAWDADFIYSNGWRNMAPMAKAKDSDKLRRNSYRVLLTRGRDGLVIFVPDERTMDGTHQVLLRAGCREFSSCSLHSETALSQVDPPKSLKKSTVHVHNHY